MMSMTQLSHRVPRRPKVLCFGDTFCMLVPVKMNTECSLHLTYVEFAVGCHLPSADQRHQRFL